MKIFSQYMKTNKTIDLSHFFSPPGIKTNSLAQLYVKQFKLILHKNVKPKTEDLWETYSKL